MSSDITSDIALAYYLVLTGGYKSQLNFNNILNNKIIQKF